MLRYVYLGWPQRQKIKTRKECSAGELLQGGVGAIHCEEGSQGRPLRRRHLIKDQARWMAGSRRGRITDVFRSWKQQDFLSESGYNREKKGRGCDGCKQQLLQKQLMGFIYEMPLEWYLLHFPFTPNLITLFSLQLHQFQFGCAMIHFPRMFA